jgi:GPI ethanolamine phosphate transferase 3 subunit O
MVRVFSFAEPTYNQLTYRYIICVHLGDDTWESLYPKKFNKALPLPSFDVWDLDTVDTEVKK